jgi:hypothetical protein
VTTLTDNFNRSNNSTSLGTPSDAGAAYVVSSASQFGIDSNAAAYTGSTTPSWFLRPLSGGSSTADGVVEATLGNGTVQYVALTLCSSAGVGYVCFLGLGSNGDAQLWTYAPGYSSVSGFASVSWTSGDVAKLEKIGSSIKLYRNGSQVGSTVTNSTYSTITHGGVHVYSSNTTFRIDALTVGDGAAPSAPAPADRTLYAADPDTATTGLTAVDATASASANATALAAQAAYVATNWGSGRIVLPSGDSIPCGPLGTWPAKVELSALEGTVLDQSSLTGTQVGISIVDTDFTPLRRVILKGPGKTSTCVGLSVTGSGLTFDQVGVREWGKAVDLVHANTYIITFRGGGIGESGVCVDAAVNGVVSNSGEKILFDGVTFFNSPLGLNLDTGGGSVLLKACSIDYCAVSANLYSGHTEFEGCHIETADTVATGGYVFDANYNSVTTFTGCRFILAKAGSGGLRWILNPAHGPWNYGFGRVSFGPGNRAYFYDSNGASANVSSDELMYVAAAATTATIESPFVHKWGPITALPAWNDGQLTQAGITVRPSVNVSTGVVTLTASSAPVTNALPVRVQF